MLSSERRGVDGTDDEDAELLDSLSTGYATHARRFGSIEHIDSGHDVWCRGCPRWCLRRRCCCFVSPLSSIPLLLLLLLLLL